MTLLGDIDGGAAENRAYDLSLSTYHGRKPSTAAVTSYPTVVWHYEKING